MKIGIFGGTFDPVHNGHTRLADEAFTKLGLDKTVIVPAGVSPFKQKSQTGDAHRLQMCRLAFADERFAVSTLETERAGKSYTVDTVKLLKSQYPGQDFVLLMGADQLLKFNCWYAYREILQNTSLCAVCRSSLDDRAQLERFADEYLRQYGECTVMDFVPLDISSTLIRQKVKNNEDIFGLVPKKVGEYIQQEGLYRD